MSDKTVNTKAGRVKLKSSTKQDDFDYSKLGIKSREAYENELRLTELLIEKLVNCGPLEIMEVRSLIEETASQIK